MRCSFCATGKGGFARNLKAHEIMDQVMTVQEEFGSRVSNIGRDCIGIHTICSKHVVSKQVLPALYALAGAKARTSAETQQRQPQCECISVWTYVHMQSVYGQV